MDEQLILPGLPSRISLFVYFLTHPATIEQKGTDGLPSFVQAVLDRPSLNTEIIIINYKSTSYSVSLYLNIE